MLIGGFAGTASGGITSFAMSSLKQSKINEEISNLGKRIGKLSKSDKKQRSGQHNINLKILKDGKNFIDRIQEALCSASKTHIQNERLLERNYLKTQYHTAFSNVVSAITKGRITPEIIPIRSLRNNFKTWYFVSNRYFVCIFGRSNSS